MAAATDPDHPPMSPERREAFELRVERWWPDLLAGLRAIYPADQVQPVADRLLALAEQANAERSHDLHRLDQRRLLSPDWFQQPRMFGYACYTERFAGDLPGVARRLDHLTELGVSYLHLMPVLRPRDGDNDGGYAVQDYRTVRPDLGDVDDLRALADDLRGRGISLVLDLVLNHVAREHEWAVRARAGEQRYRDYFYVYPDRTQPDAYEATLPEVFPDFAPGSFSFDPELDGWVWTTFNTWQWDVNWTNPEVLLEYAQIVLFLANLGVEVIRLDAIAFTWKRLGTNCQNQPEVHALTRVLRAVAKIACPALLFKAEAIVGPQDLVQYLGIGQHTGRVSELAYHNSLMVQIWSMLATSDTVLARRALQRLPATPGSAAWICYVRCHDDIGWAIDDTDARVAGFNGFEHRRFLSDWYAGEHPGSWSDGLVFQANPVTGDRRISGTAAALTGLTGTGRPPAAHDEDAGLARMFLAHAIAAGWGGIPVIWSGDELGAGNDPDWADEEGHAGDNRWAHRPRLDPVAAAARHDLSTVPGKVFHGIAHLARVRAGLPPLHAASESRVLDGVDDRVLATLRRHPSGALMGLYNVSGSRAPVPAHLLAEHGLTRPWNALGEHPVTWGADGVIWLPAYAAWWVVDAEDV